jgi:hypothetical protein
VLQHVLAHVAAEIGFRDQILHVDGHPHGPLALPERAAAAPPVAQADELPQEPRLLGREAQGRLHLLTAHPLHARIRPIPVTHVLQVPDEQGFRLDALIGEEHPQEREAVVRLPFVSVRLNHVRPELGQMRLRGVAECWWTMRKGTHWL